MDPRPFIRPLIEIPPQIYTLLWILVAVFVGSLVHLAYTVWQRRQEKLHAYRGLTLERARAREEERVARLRAEAERRRQLEGPAQ